MIKDREKFLNTMKDLELYLVEFEEDGSMKVKNYPDNCVVGGDVRRPDIVITHNKCTFSTNDGIQKAWTRIRDIFLQPKGRGQGIMVSDFLFFIWSIKSYFTIKRKKKKGGKKKEK